MSMCVWHDPLCRRELKKATARELHATIPMSRPIGNLNGTDSLRHPIDVR